MKKTFSVPTILLVCFGTTMGGLLSSASEELSKVDFSMLLEPIKEQPLEEKAEPELSNTADQLIDVNSLAQTITAELVVASLMETGEATLEEGDSLEISLKSKWVPFEIDADAEWILYAADRFAPDHRGNWSPSLVLEVDGSVVKRWRVNCDVDLYRPVYMTTQRLDRGEIPAEPAIRPVICNIYEEPTRPVPVLESLGDYEMERTLAEGQYLTWDDISRRPTIRKGDTVDVVLTKGRLSITMQAMSLDDGLLEDTVRLKNTRTRVEFAGIVKAPGVVQVRN